MDSKPIAIPIVAAFLAAAGVVAVIVGLAFLFPGRLLAWLATLNPRGMATFTYLGKVAGLLLLALGLVTALTARGLLRRQAWAWWSAVGLFTVNACGDFVSGFITGDWLRAVAGVAISLVFLYSLRSARMGSTDAARRAGK